MGRAVSSYRYRTIRCDGELRARLVELARAKPRFGYRRLQVLLQRGGERVNHKRVHRVYREAGLSLRRKKRKHCVRVGKPLLERTAANQEWGLDFVHDAVECGRAIRVLSVVDAYTRECLALEVDTSFASRRVTRVLEAIVAERGQPLAIRCDNGPELTSRHFLAWCVERQIERNCTSCPIAQASSARLQNSLPLSTVMLSGRLPRSCCARSSACATFIPVIERSASNPTHSRVNWSTTVRIRKERPSANLSLTKSILQHWLARAATAVVTASCRRAIFRRCFVRTINSSSRYSR